MLLESGAAPHIRRAGLIILVALALWRAHGLYNAKSVKGPSEKVAIVYDVPSVELANGVLMPTISFGTADISCLGPCQFTTAFGPYALGNETLIRASQCGTTPGANGELSTFDGVVEAYKNGFRAFDTANNYCTQPATGDALRSLGVERTDYFISTKVSPQYADTSEGGENLKAQLQASLSQMQVEYVDLIMMHQPDFSGTCAANQAAWRQLEEYYLAGYARAIGELRVVFGPIDQRPIDQRP